MLLLLLAVKGTDETYFTRIKA